MARLVYTGTADLVSDLNTVLRIPDDVKRKMLQAGADVIVEKQKQNVPVKTGTLRESIIVSKIKTNTGGGTATIAFDGIHHVSKKNGREARNAEVAYVNEYGKKGQTATQFIRRSNEQAAGPAADAAAKVYSEWLDESNL